MSSCLPPDAKSHLDSLDLDPELRELAERTFPDADRDAEAKAAKRRLEQERVEQEHRRRVEICQKALEGEYGKEVMHEAHRVAGGAQGEFTPFVVQAIYRLYQQHEAAKRNPPKKDGAR